MINNFAVLVKR